RRALRLVTFLVAILSRFHAANGDVGAGGAMPPAFEPPTQIVFQHRWRRSKLLQLLFPAQGMALFRLGHAQQNVPTLLVTFVGGQIAIDQRSLPLRAPI